MSRPELASALTRPVPATPGRTTCPALQPGGQPLPAAERTLFEPWLGTDLSAVRFHDDAAAHAAARRIHARTFTHRQDVWCNTGRYRPGEVGGRRLLPHELVRTVTQPGRPGARR